MPRRDDLFGRLPRQHVGDVRRAPRLPDAGDARKDLLCDGERVGDRVELLEAPVARAAVPALVVLSEYRPASGDGSGSPPRKPPCHAAGARALAPLAVGLGIAASARGLRPSRSGRTRPAGRPPRAARLLLIVLRRPRRPGVRRTARSTDRYPSPNATVATTMSTRSSRTSPGCGCGPRRTTHRGDTALAPRPSATRPALPLPCATNGDNPDSPSYDQDANQLRVEMPAADHAVLSSAGRTIRRARAARGAAAR